MRRTDIINKLIERHNYKSYLEIGTWRTDSNFDYIKIKEKLCVDPFPVGCVDFKGTSDEYFESIKDTDTKFDIIFIDGLHHDYQVTIDIENSLKHLSENGIIVCHDCLPENESMQHKEPSYGAWTGDVWKSIAKLRIERNDLEIDVVDTDYGVGLIRKGVNIPYKYDGQDLSYDFYEKNRFELLNVISVENFLNKYIVEKKKYDEYNEDIFIIDCWTDTPSKENDLINLISILKQFNIPILLTGHYAIKPEIQKMVDYFLFDKNNDLLMDWEFDDYGVSSGRWTEMSKWIVDNRNDFHHDYAIWSTMRNSFNFAKMLGKKYIHFLEYDNLPDPIQYRQSFLEYSRNYDAVLYEYHKGSAKDKHFAEYCATYIFSIKTDIAIQVIDKVKTKREYFSNRPKGWQLEKVFLQHLKEVTNNIIVSKYIANNNELNTQAVWNRDGIDRNNARFQIYLAVDENREFYIHFISGFHEQPADSDYVVEVNYQNYKTFNIIKKDTSSILKIGEYKKGESVKVYYQGVIVFDEYLKDNFVQFYKKNKLTWKNKHDNLRINYHFVDGAYVHLENDVESEYDVDYIDKKTNDVIYKSVLKNNWWAKTSKKYFVDWKIIVKSENFEQEINSDYSDKRILITFESKSLGDNLAWIPYVEAFRKKHNAKVICSTFWNDLFKETYKEIEFVEPGNIVENIYAQYRIGLFKDGDKINYDYHPNNPLTQPLTKIASDILGLEYVELKPNLLQYNYTKKKKVSIATHSTAQCKYWNNPNGWQEVVDYLKEKGYEVTLLSKEEDGYMGNRNPTGVTQLKPGNIERVIKVIQESELFIGLSSGLSWLSWACNVPTVLVSGFTDDDLEPKNGVYRVINKNVCHGCWSRHDFNPGDWNWCPEHKGTNRQFECSKEITSEMVIEQINKIIS